VAQMSREADPVRSIFDCSHGEVSSGVPLAMFANAEWCADYNLRLQNVVAELDRLNLRRRPTRGRDSC
jgi:hypothetical protein